MSLTKRATIYLDADLHRAVRMKAAEIERSVSDLVNAALRHSLAEDATISPRLATEPRSRTLTSRPS